MAAAAASMLTSPSSLFLFSLGPFTTVIMPIRRSGTKKTREAGEEFRKREEKMRRRRPYLRQNRPKDSAYFRAGARDSPKIMFQN